MPMSPVQPAEVRLVISTKAEPPCQSITAQRDDSGDVPEQVPGRVRAGASRVECIPVRPARLPRYISPTPIFSDPTARKERNSYGANGSCQAPAGTTLPSRRSTAGSESVNDAVAGRSAVLTT